MSLSFVIRWQRRSLGSKDDYSIYKFKNQVEAIDYVMDEIQKDYDSNKYKKSLFEEDIYMYDLICHLEKNYGINFHSNETGINEKYYRVISQEADDKLPLLLKFDNGYTPHDKTLDNFQKNPSNKRKR